METFLFWNILLTYKILAVILFIDEIATFILNESACATGLYDWSKSIPLIWELPFTKFRATNFHASEQSPSLILGWMSERTTFVSSGRGFIVMGAEIRPTFLFLSYWTNRYSFQNCFWGYFKTSPILFGMGGFFGILTSRCETTGLTWSDTERISSGYFLC